MSETEQKLLSPADLAQMLGRTVTAIQTAVAHRLANLCPMPSLTAGRRNFWRVKDVEVWIEKKAAEQAARRAKITGPSKKREPVEPENIAPSMGEPRM